jgi:hypothetical protein
VLTHVTIASAQPLRGIISDAGRTVRVAVTVIARRGAVFPAERESPVGRNPPPSAAGSPGRLSCKVESLVLRRPGR